MANDSEKTSDKPEGPKMVPESDLLAIKKGLEGQLEKVRTELSESKGKADNFYQELLGERGHKEAAQSELQKLQDTKSKLEEAQAQLEASKTASGELQNKFLDMRRQFLMEQYNAPKDAVEGKGQQELDTLEEALKIVGAKRGSGIDSGGGGGIKAPLTAREKITIGLERRQQEKRKGG